MTEFYNGSKGPVRIKTMPFTQAKNSLNKLERTDPSRTGEIDALKEHLENLGKQYRFDLEAEKNGGSASAERIAEIEAELARLDGEAS
jgi:hypothetical protein